MKNVTVSYNVTDNCGPVTTTLSVTSNEPQSGTGNGDEPIDWQIIDNHRLKLRAERAGSGDGRIYTITIRATDAAGNVSTQTVTVAVPHDRSNEITATSGKGEELTVLSSPFKVTVAPNPAKEQFLLQLKVTDAAGRIIERRAGIAPNSSLRIGATYRPGTYYVEVTQGEAKQTLKLVKQSR